LVHVGAMVDAYDVDGPSGLVDAVDDPVRAANGTDDQRGGKASARL
jgi:hypothetical protein